MVAKIANKLKLKLVGSLLSTILLGGLVIAVIIAYMNSSLGWFSNNLSANGVGMQVEVGMMEAIADYTIYVFDAKENAVRFTGDGKENDPQIDNLKMQIHDVIFKSRNRWTPAIVHIRLHNIQEQYRSAGTVSLTLKRNNDAQYITDPENGKILLPDKTTSILRFTLVNNIGTSWLGTNANSQIAADETYHNIDDALYAKVVTNKDYSDTQSIKLDSKIFTNVSKDGSGNITGITKASQLTLSVSFTAAEVADGELDLFLYLTYDEDLVKDFENTSGIDTSDSSVGKVTPLSNDLTRLLISFVTD